MEPVYFEVTFKKGSVNYTEYFKTYIELTDQDLDVRNENWSMESKTSEIVRRVGILDILPTGISDDWPRSGRIIDDPLEIPWDSAVTPTRVSGHRVWIQDELKWSRLATDERDY
jgi:hypothetical protein